MITDLPTTDDFLENGENLLNVAWGILTHLLTTLNEIIESDIDDTFNDRDSEKYWIAARQTLSTSLAIAQQATEFLIKAKISAVSPFLIFTGSPSSWPKHCDKKNTHFSEFHTIDAQDLIRVHDTVCETKFNDKFKQTYNDMRELRNKIMHTVDRQLSIKPEQVAKLILEVHYYLVGEKKWIACRRQFLDRSPDYSIKYIRQIAYKAYVLRDLMTELAAIIDLLKPSEVKKYFGYNKRSRSCLCPKCYELLSQLDLFNPEYDSEIIKPAQFNDYKNTMTANDGWHLFC